MYAKKHKVHFDADDVPYVTLAKNYGFSSWSRLPSQRKVKAKRVKS